MEYTLSFARLFFIELVFAGPILVFLVLLISLMGSLIGRMEGWSQSDALYHAFINATTVGYGDFRPTQKLSKMLTVVNALVDLVFVGIVVAIDLIAAVYAFMEVYDTSEVIKVCASKRSWSYSRAGF